MATDATLVVIVLVIPWILMMHSALLVVTIIAVVDVLALDQGLLTMTDTTGLEAEAGAIEMNAKRIN